MPLLEPAPMPFLNIAESDVLDRTENLLGKKTKWEAHMTQQIPLPRSISPYLVDRPGSLEQLELKTEDDMDIKNYMERLANDKRPSKPKCGPSLLIQISSSHPRLALTTLCDCCYRIDKTIPNRNQRDPA